MRSCIYCGRELKDGEQCDCPKATARRAAKAAQNGNGSSAGNGSTTDNGGYTGGGSSAGSGYYRTGYTQNDGGIRRRWNRFKAKAASRRNRPGGRSSMRGILSYTARFIKSPAEEIANPRDLSWLQMILTAAAQGAVIGLCVFFVVTGTSRSWLKALANIIGFGGINGYRTILYAAAAAVSGAIGGIVFFLVHAGIFRIISRFIFRSRAGFKELAQRLVLTNVPFTLFAAVGVLFSIFSETTLVVLLMCGALSSFILTYISLREEWPQYSESRVFYAVLLGYFVLFAFIFSLLRISMF